MQKYTNQLLEFGIHTSFALTDSLIDNLWKWEPKGEMEDKDSKLMNQWKNAPVREERCYEPIARCLIRALIVPKIYFEWIWPPSGRSRVDIISVDRAGTGDIHVVEVCKTLNEALTKGVTIIRDIPAHYRWVAFQGEGLLPHDGNAELKLLSEEPLLPESGMVRIGVIEVILTATMI